MPYLPMNVRKYIKFDGKIYKCQFCDHKSKCSPCIYSHVLNTHLEDIKKLEGNK
jgi:hypothetical protein